MISKNIILYSRERGRLGVVVSEFTSREVTVARFPLPLSFLRAQPQCIQLFKSNTSFELALGWECPLKINSHVSRAAGTLCSNTQQFRFLSLDCVSVLPDCLCALKTAGFSNPSNLHVSKCLKDLTPLYLEICENCLGADKRCC